MTYINIPSIDNIDLKLDIVYQKKNQDENQDKNEIIICESMFEYINLMKKNINTYSSYWDIFKKISNPYEYIHTQIPNTKISICKYFVDHQFLLNPH